MDKDVKIKLLQYLNDIELEVPAEYIDCIDIEAVKENVNEILTLRGENIDFTREEISERVARIPHK